MHVSAAHHALKNAFLTCLKCTHPGAAPVFLLYFNAYLMFLSEYLRVCLEKKLKIVVASQMLKTVFKYQLFKRIFRCGSPLPLTNFFFFFGKKKTTKLFSTNKTLFTQHYSKRTKYMLIFLGVDLPCYIKKH